MVNHYLLFVECLLLCSCTFQKADHEQVTFPQSLIVHLAGLDTLKSEQIGIPNTLELFQELVVEYEGGVFYQTILKGNLKTTKIVFPNMKLAKALQLCKAKTADENMLAGKFINQVFNDSFPTTAWEQLIHLEDNEATIVVKTNGKGSIVSLFMDVNPHIKTNRLVLTQSGEELEILYEYEGMQQNSY